MISFFIHCTNISVGNIFVDDVLNSVYVYLPWPCKLIFRCCSPVATHIKGADELLICAMPAARNVNIIHLFALQPML